MPDLRVLYVTDRWDAPYRYRCWHACQQLRGEGVVANVRHLDSSELLADVNRYSVVVLFRLPWNERVEAVVTAARSARVPLVFDVDDLVFDPALEGLLGFRRSIDPDVWRATYGRQLTGLRRTFDACDFFVGSTPALVEHAERLDKPAAVHPNVVPDRYLSAGRWAKRVRKRLRQRPTLGYFAGSNTHDDDLASIAGPLETVLLATGARLVLGGHVDPGPRLRKLEHRIHRLPFLHWSDFGWAHALCHASLAPLAERNEFTDGKSALKFFEAGAFSVPVVATPVREMRDAVTSGTSGWLAADENDWVEALSAALVDSESDRVGAAARRAVESNHSSATVAGRLRGVLEGVAATPTGPVPRTTRLEPPGEGGAGAWLGADAWRFGSHLRALVRIADAPDRPAVDADGLFRSLLASQEVTAGDSVRARVFEVSGEIAWKANEQIVETGELPGESRSIGSDPFLTSPELAVDAAGFRYALIWLRASTRTERAAGQLYWRSEAQASFTEEQSLSFRFAATGAEQWIVLDLQSHDEWETARTVARLRLDPLDRPGSFRVGAVALLPEAVAVDPPATEGPSGRPSIEASAESIADWAAGASAGAAADCVARGSAREVREALAASVGHRSILVERLIERPGEVEVRLVRRPDVEERGVDVVVPVYGSAELTLRCLRSVLRHGTGDFRLVVVDDASPDAETRNALEGLAEEDPRVVLLKQRHNLGFVKTANHGIRHAAGRDVLLLNSDTEVFEGFLHGLRAAATSSASVGLVSPLSNNATICSVPEFCRYNPVPAGLSRADMAELVRRVGPRTRPALVTPHGFCLYLTAEFLADVGDFDEDLYGRGFGEENDLGERAKAAGWEIRLADDVYVWHEGKGSFGEEGEALEKKHAPILERQHPGYHAAVARFVEDNPLREIHENLAWHLRRRSATSGPAPLFVLHADPFAEERGGVEHCVADLIRSLALERAVLAFPMRSGIAVAEVLDGRWDQPLRYAFDLEAPIERFAHEHLRAVRCFRTIVRRFRVGRVHVHHLMFWPLSVRRVLDDESLPYTVTLHDYYSVCPSFNLLDGRSALCCPASIGDSARTRACQRSLHERLSLPAPTDAVRHTHEHRAAFSELLAGASHVVAPSRSTAALVEGALSLSPGRVQVVPHGYDLPARDPRSDRNPGPLRIGLLGEISYPSKGSHAYLAVMQACADADLEWHVFGRTDRFGFDRQLDRSGARVVRHGSYERDAIVDLLVQADLDVGLLLPPWPETFSYTLSELLAAHVPVVASRRGALADRLDGQDYGLLVDSTAEARALLTELARDPARLRKLREAASQFDHEGAQPWSARWAALDAECARGAPEWARRPAERDDLVSLADARVGSPLAASAPRAVAEPDPKFAQSWWYPRAERIGARLPETVRQWARHRLATQRLTAVRTYRLPGRAVRLGPELVLERKYWKTARFVARGTDPYLVIDVRDLDPHAVSAIRFNLWCGQGPSASAQLYWRDEDMPDFTEERSLRVALDGQTGRWQEYVVSLDAHEQGAGWYSCNRIAALRFDPIDFPGPVCLGELALCQLAG